jgi:hypothetical protein
MVSQWHGRPEPVKKIENLSGAGVSPAIRRSRKPKNFRRLRAGGGQKPAPLIIFSQALPARGNNHTGENARATDQLTYSRYTPASARNPSR